MKMYKIRDSIQKDLVNRLMNIVKNSEDSTLVDSISNIVHIFESSLMLLNVDSKSLEEEPVVGVPDQVSEIIKQGQSIPSEFLIAVGHASMCWEHPERAGIFDTEQAIQVAQRLFDLSLKEYV